MTSYRRLKADDLFKTNIINLDKFTENYHFGFYANYMIRWPEYCMVAESLDGRPIGYIMGKSEGTGSNWHGHVTVLTISPWYRRLGLAHKLMDCLENVSESGKMYFVDLFVRIGNVVAVDMYRKFGYSVYRRIIDYYSGAQPEDAFDMRKALSRDVTKASVIPLPHPVHADDLDY